MTHSPLIPGFNWTHRDSWGTHQPVLYEAIKRCPASKEFPILELGCGLHSTPLISAIRGNKKVISVDSDSEWLESCRKKYESENHEFKLLSFEEMKMNGFYSVVFIDQGSWESRAECLKHYSAAAFFIVLHDSDYLPRELSIDFDKIFYYHKTFMPLPPYPFVTGPPTTILSNMVDMRSWEINYEDYQ